MFTRCPECKGIPNANTVVLEGSHIVYVEKCPYCRGVGFCEIYPASRQRLIENGFTREADIVFGKEKQ